MSLVTIFIIKSTLSDIYMDISALFLLLFAWCVFFHLFSFNLSAPLNLKCISGRQYIVSSLLFLKILAYWVECLVHLHPITYKVRFGLLRWLSGKESTCQHRRLRRCRFDPWVGKIPWRRNWKPTLVFLSMENSMDRGAWQSMDLQRVWHDWTTEHNPTQVRFTPVIAICWLYAWCLCFFFSISPLLYSFLLSRYFNFIKINHFN